jgi:hypothetical protein
MIFYLFLSHPSSPRNGGTADSVGRLGTQWGGGIEQGETRLEETLGGEELDRKSDEKEVLGREEEALGGKRNQVEMGSTGPGGCVGRARRHGVMCDG